jgi:hypothetical protein
MLYKLDSMFGHVIEETDTGVIYKADGAPVDFACPRACIGCGAHVKDGEQDPCIVNLPGTVQACCGHGLERTPEHNNPNGYVGLKDGRTFRFLGTVGGERIRLAVEAALAGQSLPEGFNFDADRAWWEGLSEAQRAYVHNGMRPGLAEIVRDITGANTVDDDIVSGARMWFDGRSDEEKDIVRSRIPGMIERLVMEALAVAD